ncbi:hypothetical protein B0H63DRAFT_501571 [Podospora didyma]|uniref:Heterokaryon incompatibility domain-containing protein n=1 Tax=Podospora didyma TaxID=330526 RepID=A0AAE0NQP7_9PEZI|nr:hypothetical protein B0H63DRAFT_501571 [Podospora didyma]
MRLINARTLKTEEYYESQIPPYAILSHTWSGSEVSFQDFQDVELRTRKGGFRKIQRTCEQALEHGIKHVWLSESINSMFQWYQKAKICYAYLEDVEDDWIDRRTSEIGMSRWFTRGWTLQELIAPRVVQFYSRGWARIGEKHGLINKLEVTTRVEDMACCLLGLFGISMPLLYSEGHKAFYRLQEAIIAEYDDHSIFAWSMDQNRSYSNNGLPYPVHGGILAASPAGFKSSGNIKSVRAKHGDDEPVTVTAKGVRAGHGFWS